MKLVNRIIFSLIMIFAFATNIQAEASAVDFLRSTGKIYSVIAVIVVVLLGIGIFLFRIDKKLTKLENTINNEQ